MKLAFIGGFGHHYLGGLVKDKAFGVEKVAVAAGVNDTEAAKPRVDRHKAAGVEVQWFDDPRTMLDQFKPDVVNVGTIYAHNGAMILEAVKRGIPTLSDKPIAASWETYHQLVEETNRTGVPVVSEFPFRSDPAVRAARDAVRQGLIGKVVLASGQKSYRFGAARPEWYARREDYGSTVLWVASHAIDWISFATGQHYTRVFGRQGNVAKPDYGTMEDVTVNVMELESGAMALVHADYSRPAKAATHGDDRLRIAGGTGVLEVRDGRCRLCNADMEETDITDRAQPAPVHVEMYEALQGKHPELYSTALSLRMAKVLLHCRDAADGRRTVDIV